MARRKKMGALESLFFGCLAGLVGGCTARTVQTRYGSTKSYTNRKRGQAHYW